MIYLKRTWANDEVGFLTWSAPQGVFLVLIVKVLGDEEFTWCFMVIFWL